MGSLNIKYRFKDASVTPQFQGVLFFFYHFTKSVVTEYLFRARPTLVCQSCRARSAWSIMRTWPSLSQRNVAPHCRDRASLLHTHSLVVMQCLALLLRHRTLCRDMENPMSWNFLSQWRVHPITTQASTTQSQRKLS